MTAADASVSVQPSERIWSALAPTNVTSLSPIVRRAVDGDNDGMEEEWYWEAVTNLKTGGAAKTVRKEGRGEEGWYNTRWDRARMRHSKIL